jgi:hypothetical protein
MLGRQLILMGNMNGRTGRKTGDTVVGNFGEDMVNDNDERLIELCTQTSLKIWNGFFNHKNIYKYTREQHTKNFKTIIDYIIIKQDLKLKIQNVRVYRGTNCETDHKLLEAKILFPYMHTTTDKHEKKKENMETIVDKNRKYNIESLRNESTKFLYQQRLTNKLNQNEFADREEMYNYLKNYRGISVTSTFGRIYGRILATLVDLEHRNMEMEEQAGFQAGRLCIYIFCITQMIEKKKATNRELHLLFIDLT